MAGDSEHTLNSDDATGQEPCSTSQEKPLMERALPGIFSPHLAKERQLWGKMLLTFVVLLVATILGILSIYWGADHSLQFNLPVFTVAIIDFDQGEVGPALQQAGAMARSSNPEMTLGYVSEPGSRYNFSNEQVIHALKQEHFWMAMVVQANATTAMNYAYDMGNMSYDPTGSIHLIFEEGRNALTIDESAYPEALRFLNSFVLEFARTKHRSLATSNAGNATALARQAQNPIPISFSVFNTAPYVPSTAEAATEIGTICKLSTIVFLLFTNCLPRSNNHIFSLGPHVQCPQRSNDGKDLHTPILHLSNACLPSRLLLLVPPLPRPLVCLANPLRQVLRCLRLRHLLDDDLDGYDGVWFGSRECQ